MSGALKHRAAPEAGAHPDCPGHQRTKRPGRGLQVGKARWSMTAGTPWEVKKVTPSKRCRHLQTCRPVGMIHQGGTGGGPRTRAPGCQVSRAGSPRRLVAPFGRRGSPSCTTWSRDVHGAPADWAVAQTAARAGHRVWYFTGPDLVETLYRRLADNSVSKTHRHVAAHRSSS